jgi:hypothetical protein
MVLEPVINYGSGSDFLTSYGSGSKRQKVTVPTVTVPVPQHCFRNRDCGKDFVNKVAQASIRYDFQRG